MTDAPKDVAVRARQVAASSDQMMSAYPPWFQEQYKRIGAQAWAVILNEAADELDQMRQLNGRLMRTLYGD